MSEIIKSGDVRTGFRVRSLSALTAAATRQAQHEEQLLQRVRELEAEIRNRDEAIERLKIAMEQTRKEALAEGRTLGLNDAEDRARDRVAVLETYAAQAVSALSVNLSSLERLAPLLAQDCLEKIFGSADKYREMIADILASQLKTLEKSAVIRIAVSREDFPDTASLDALAQKTNVGPLELIATDSPAGSCVLTLRLGQIDVGLQQQWSALRDALAELALPAVMP